MARMSATLKTERPNSTSALIAKTLRMAMREQGITQTSLAAKLGVTQATVSSFLDGSPLEESTIARLCEAIGIQWDNLTFKRL